MTTWVMCRGLWYRTITAVPRSGQSNCSTWNVSAKSQYLAFEYEATHSHLAAGQNDLAVQGPSVGPLVSLSQLVRSPASLPQEG